MRAGVITASVLAVAVGSACVGTEKERKEQARALDACRGDATDAEVQENILISEEYAKALETTLTIGWVPFLYALDFSILIAETFLLGLGEDGRYPEDWSYEDGTYYYGGPTAAIEMRVLLSEDLEIGAAGTPITEDIWLLDSYLLDADISYDDASDLATISYSAPGPLVELLGFGPEPDNPLVLDAGARTDVVESLLTLALEPEFIALGTSGSTLFDFHVRSPAQTMADLVAQETHWTFELVEVNASRELAGQRLLTGEWAVESTWNQVLGYTTFSTEGGHFPFRGRIDFTEAPVVAPVVIAERELACP